MIIDPATHFFASLHAGASGTVVLYGTSLTQGAAWAAALMEWFAHTFAGRVAVHNCARGGETSTWGCAQLAETVLPLHPDLVLIEFSYNDAHLKFKLTPAQSVAQLEQMVMALRAQNPDCAIVVQLMNPPWDSPGRHAAAIERPEITTFNEAWRDYAAHQRLPLIDHGPAWARLRADPEAFARAIPDGSHPKAEASLAHTWPTVRAWLDRASLQSKS